MKLRSILSGLICLIGFWPAMLRAQLPGGSDLARIGSREFVLDQGRILSKEQKKEIQSICAKLLDDSSIPIIVVTIHSMREFPGRPQQMEGFARSVFDEWGIGFPSQDKNSWNRGILILVSPGDRQARIELGADWARKQDAECARIMQEQMIPYFRSGNYAGGILAGVRGLETMARLLKESGPGEKLGEGQSLQMGESGKSSSSSAIPAGHPPIAPLREEGSPGSFIFLIVLIIFAARVLLPILSLFGYRGSSAYYGSPRRGYFGSDFPRHSSGGSISNRGFSGGSRASSSGRSSFGGGSSGGGGATGSW